MSAELIAHCLDLLSSRDMCVLATCAGDAPHCSLMAYALDPARRHVLMLSPGGSRKSGNLRANPRASLLVDTREEATCLGRDRYAVEALTVSVERASPESAGDPAELRAATLRRHEHLRGFSEQEGVELLVLRLCSFQLLQGVERSRLVML